MGVSAENTALTGEILEAQRGIYEKDENNADYFVSLPFCPSKCEYCSFITAPIDKTRGFLPAYLDCLTKEIEASAPLIKNLRSVYIGGGTPFAEKRVRIHGGSGQTGRVFGGKAAAFKRSRGYAHLYQSAELFGRYAAENRAETHGGGRVPGV